MKNIINNEIICQKVIDTLLQQKNDNISLGADRLSFHAHNFNYFGGQQLEDIRNQIIRDELDYGGVSDDVLLFFLQALRKEFYSILVLSSISDYTGVCRILRYMWESIAKAYYMDTDEDYKKVEYRCKFLMFNKEFNSKNRFGWPNIAALINDIRKGKNTGIKIKNTWDRLNEACHLDLPSIQESIDTPNKTPFRYIFDKSKAEDTLSLIDGVYDVVYLFLSGRYKKSMVTYIKNSSNIGIWKKYAKITCMHLKIQ